MNKCCINSSDCRFIIFIESIIAIAMKQTSPKKPQFYTEKIIKLQQQFLKACLSYNATPSYCQLYIQSFNNRQYANKQEQYKKKTFLFADQINQFKRGQSFLQRLQTILSQRQQILRSLRQQLITNRNQKPVNITECCEKLSHIRMYNLTIVQELQLLKQKLRIDESKYITEISTKLLRDIDFLRQTSLRKHIEFSTLDDPFFLIPLKKIWDLELASNYHHKSVVELFTVDQNYKKRLLMADKAIKNTIFLSQQKPAQKQSERNENVSGLNKAKTEPNQLDQNQTTSKFFLPSINKEIPQKSSTLKNSVENIIKTYQNREKLKKKQERYIQNAIKKRAVTQANQYQSERANHSPQIKRSVNKKRAHSIDDDHDDEPQSTYFRSFPAKHRHISLQSIKKSDVRSDPPTQKINPFNTIQVQPFILHIKDRQSQKKEPKIQKDNDESAVVKGKRNKRYMNRNGDQQLKETVYNTFSYKNNNPSAEETHYKSNYQKQKKQQQIKHTNLVRYDLSSIEQVEEQKKAKKYKSPLDLLKQVRYRKRELQGSIVRYEQQDEQSQIQKEQDVKIQTIEYSQNQSKPSIQQQGKIDEQALIKKIIQSMKKSPNLKIEQLNLNQQIQIKLDNKNQSKVMSSSFAGQEPQKNSSSSMQNQILEEKEKQQQPYQPQIIIRQQPMTNKNTKKKRNKPLSLHKQFEIHSNNSDKQSYTFQTQVNLYKSEVLESQQLQQAEKKLGLQKQYQIHALFEPHKQKKQDKNQQQQSIKRKTDEKDKKILSKQFSFQKNTQIQSKNSSKVISQQEQIARPQSYNILDPRSYKYSQPTGKQARYSNNSLQQINEQSQIQYPYSQQANNNNYNTQAYKQKQIRRNPLVYSQNVQMQPLYKDNKRYTDDRYQDSTINSQKYKQSARMPQQIHFRINSTKKSSLSPLRSPNDYQRQLPQSKVNISLDQSSREQPSMKESQKPSFSKQQTKILKQCVFQSKSIEQSQLFSLLSSFKSKKASKLLEYTRKESYFTNRHIIFSTCSYNNETVCYCITSPYLTLQSRYLFILHLQIIQQSFEKITSQLFSTFIKYILFNDPTNNLLYLRLKNIFDQEYVDHFEMIKNYSGQVKTPIKSLNIEDKSYLFVRKQIKCRSIQDYTSIFNSIALFVSTKNQDEELAPIKNNNLHFSLEYIKRIQAGLKLKEVKKFLDNTKLQKYLEQNRLPKFKQYKQNKNLILYQMILQDCLNNVRYYSFAKYFYFTIEPPFTYFYSTQNIYYLFISTSFKNKYYVIGDRIYEQSQNVDIYRDFKKNIMNKKLSELKIDQKMKGRIVSCPQFKKTVETSLTNNTSAIVNFQLNWKDYIKGTRYLRQQQIYIQLIGPLLCSLVQINENKVISHIYSTIIQKNCIGK